MTSRLFLIVALALSLSSPTLAATKKIAGQISPASSANKIIVITSKGSKTGSIASNGKFSVTLPSGASAARIAFTKNSEVVGYLFAKKCLAVNRCTVSKLAGAFKANAALPKAKYSSSTGRFTVGTFRSQTAYKKMVVQSFVNASVSASGKNLGLVNIGSSSILGGPRTLVDPNIDEDGDGAPDLLDVDDDNDGITDNYDSASVGTSEESFPMFSNLKVELQNAVNVNTGTATQEQIDNLMSSTATLAIGVLAGDGETSELNCGSLGYCSAGGTGMGLNDHTAFPGTAGGANDSDSDGFGEIIRGNTGDFQLSTGAVASAIGAGDSIIQVVTNGSTVREVPGMLNFIFNTTPAIKTVQINSEAASTITYPVGGADLGTFNNCFPVPSSGDVKVTLTGWRPQRPGIIGAGEATYMDIGSSRIVIDIPNAPCSVDQSGGCSGNGPGACSGTYYTTTDTNLSTDGSEGLLDIKGDVPAAVDNTFTFTIDLDDCLTDDSIAWNSGEKLAVDIQLKDRVGDNAAVKTCFRRQ